MMPEEENRNKEEREDNEKSTKIFQLPADNDRPFGVDRVMDNRPKETAGAKRKKEA